MRDPFRVIGAIFALVGAILVAACIATSLHSGKPAGWVEVPGVVVGNEARSGDEGTNYYPIVQYEVDGQSYQVTSSVGQSPAKHIGSAVPVVYDPAFPASAETYDFASRFLAPLITGGMAVVFGGIGVGLLVASSRSRAKESRARESEPVDDASVTAEPVGIVRRSGLDPEGYPTAEQPDGRWPTQPEATPYRS